MSNKYQWDIVVKLTHWSVAVLFISNYFLTEAGSTLHQWIGYTIIGLVFIRLLWGMITRSPARLTHFLPNIKSALTHLSIVSSTKKDDHVGHNPAGAIMIWAMWIGILLTGGSGWILEASHLGHWFKEVHELFANLTFMCACMHVAAVVLMTRFTGRRYISEMWFGKKK